jgi:hypothetical protein
MQKNGSIYVLLMFYCHIKFALPCTVTKLFDVNELFMIFIRRHVIIAGNILQQMKA